MTIEADRPMVEHTDEVSATTRSNTVSATTRSNTVSATTRSNTVSATTWVGAFADAFDRGDIDSCAALVHEDVHVRVDGADTATGREDLAEVLRRFRGTRPDGGIRVVDTHVAGDYAYTLFTARPAAAVRADARRILGYGILHVRDGRLDEANCFFDQHNPPEAVPDQHNPPEAVLDLRDAAPAIDLRGAEPTDERRDAAPVMHPPLPARSRWRRLALPFAALGSWVVQDLLLAAPVVAFAARFGSLASFAVFAPLYATISLVLSLVTVRLLGTPGGAGHGRFARWLSSADHHPLTLRLLRAGSAFGFLLSAYLLSGPPTVWALHHLGIRRSLTRWAILASVIWGVGFVLFYVLVAEVVW